eukprot:scaffold199758_cov18-Prasinocladus_malaysianus.AAC.1
MVPSFSKGNATIAAAASSSMRRGTCRLEIESNEMPTLHFSMGDMPSSSCNALHLKAESQYAI